MTHPARQSAPARAPFAPLIFFVVGQPRTQGNHRVSRAGYVYDSSKQLPAWRSAVATEARVVRFTRQNMLFPVTAAVAVTLHFTCLRPRKPAHTYPRLDTDKAARAVLDSLVHGGLLADDNAVIALKVTKAYAFPGSPCGCSIAIYDAEDPCRTPTP